MVVLYLCARIVMHMQCIYKGTAVHIATDCLIYVQSVVELYFHI